MGCPMELPLTQAQLGEGYSLLRPSTAGQVPFRLALHTSGSAFSLSGAVHSKGGLPSKGACLLCRPTTSLLV